VGGSEGEILDVCQGFDIVLLRTILRTVSREFQGDRGHSPLSYSSGKFLCEENDATTGYVDGLGGGGYTVWTE
jgi:hypothetical protein